MFRFTYLFCQTKESMTACLGGPDCVSPENLAVAKCPSFPLATVAPSPWREKAKPHSREPNITCSQKGHLLPTSQKRFHGAVPRRVISFGLLVPLLIQLGGPFVS